MNESPDAVVLFQVKRSENGLLLIQFHLRISTQFALLLKNGFG